jgi:predicted acetyltransferase
MAVSLRDARIHAADRTWIEGQFRHYLDDLRASRTGVFPVLGSVGLGESAQVQGWLADRDASLLTILDNRRPAGFALVMHENGAGDIDYRMAEFYIARAQRHRGLGREAARLILDRFAGRWQVSQDAANEDAIAFWRKVLASYTRGDYRERAGGGEVRQFFSSADSSKR